MLGKLGALSEFSWLCRYSRPFLLPGKNVEIIYTPGKYYEALKVKLCNLCSYILVLQSVSILLWFHFCSMEYKQLREEWCGRHCTWVLDPGKLNWYIAKYEHTLIDCNKGVSHPLLCICNQDHNEWIKWLKSFELQRSTDQQYMAANLTFEPL